MADNKIDIKQMSTLLINLVHKCCWNTISEPYFYIISEIVNNEKDFNEKRIERNKLNAKKKLLTLKEAQNELTLLYSNIYDLNFYIYKSTTKKTIIEIQYYPKSSLEPSFFERVKNNGPMLHCKVNSPIYWKSKNEKFDVNWELGGLRDQWNFFWYKRKLQFL